MRNFLKFPTLAAAVLLATSSLTSCVATAPPTAVVVRPRPYPPRVHPPRTYYRPAPVVVVPARPVVVAPPRYRRRVVVAPAPRPVVVAPRPGRYVRVR